MKRSFSKYQGVDGSPREDVVDFSGNKKRKKNLVDPQVSVMRKKIRIKSSALNERLIKKIEKRLSRVEPKEKDSGAVYHMSIKI